MYHLIHFKLQGQKTKLYQDFIDLNISKILEVAKSSYCLPVSQNNCITIDQGLSGLMLVFLNELLPKLLVLEFSSLTSFRRSKHTLDLNLRDYTDAI